MSRRDTKSSIAYDCLSLPKREGVDCRNVGPSYAVETRGEYLAKIKRCRELARKTDLTAYHEEECKREAHIVIPGGRVSARFPESGPYPRDRSKGGPAGLVREGSDWVQGPLGGNAQGRPIRRATAERLAVSKNVGAPWVSHTQSPGVWLKTEERMGGKGQRERVYQKALVIQKALEAYRGAAPFFVVPSMPEPLLARGMPADAAYLLVRAAAGRTLGLLDEDEDDFFGLARRTKQSPGVELAALWEASTGVRLSSKELGRRAVSNLLVSYQDLPALLARLTERKTSAERRRKPMMRKNPINARVNFDDFADLPASAWPTPGLSYRAIPGQPGLFVYRKKDGTFYPKPVTRKQLNNFERIGRLGRSLRVTQTSRNAMSNPFDYDYDEMFAPANPNPRHRGKHRKSRPVPWKGAKGQFSTAQRKHRGYQPINRKNPIEPLPIPREIADRRHVYDGAALTSDEALWAVACAANAAVQTSSGRTTTDNGKAFKAAWIAHTPVGRSGWRERAVARADQEWEYYLAPHTRPIADSNEWSKHVRFNRTNPIEPLFLVFAKHVKANNRDGQKVTFHMLRAPADLSRRESIKVAKAYAKSQSNPHMALVFDDLMDAEDAGYAGFTVSNTKVMGALKNPRPKGRKQRPVPWKGAKGQFSTTQRKHRGYQPINRKNPADLSEAQIMAGFGGAEARDKLARENGSHHGHHRSVPFKGARGQFSAQQRRHQGHQPVNRTNPARNAKGQFVKSNGGAPWGYDMPPGYPYGMAKGQYGTYRAVPPTNRRNPRKQLTGWQQFVQDHAGQGKTLKQLARMWKKRR